MGDGETVRKKWEGADKEAERKIVVKGGGGGGGDGRRETEGN